jgi:hypothetical protein
VHPDHLDGHVDQRRTGRQTQLGREHRQREVAVRQRSQHRGAGAQQQLAAGVGRADRDPQHQQVGQRHLVAGRRRLADAQLVAARVRAQQREHRRGDRDVQRVRVAPGQPFQRGDQPRWYRDGVHLWISREW